MALAAEGAVTNQRDKILAACYRAHAAAAFDDAALVLAAWRAFPRDFGLRGHWYAHPDSNRVRAKVAGRDGLVARGWLEHEGPLYRLTPAGIARASETLRALAAEPVVLPSATEART